MDKKYVIGVDLGGTFIKCGLTDENGHILNRTTVPTQAELGVEKVVKNIAAAAEAVMTGGGVSKPQVKGVGIGAPGLVDCKSGIVLFSGNLGFINEPLAAKVKNAVKLAVKIDNDANCAALGELNYGKGKNFESFLFITLGTGIGGAFAENGKLLKGNKSCAGEFGHITLVKDGKKCTCGRNGCFEAYASVTALMKDAKEKLQDAKESMLWEKGGRDLLYLNGSMILECAEIDGTAEEITGVYIDYLSEGLAGLCNVLRPQAILLSGGICEAGSALAAPLGKAVNGKLLGKPYGPQVVVEVAKLKNDAGIAGAALLV